jgi:hypothetical protein
MSRSALARLFEHLLVASLPLAAPACKTSAHSTSAADLSAPSGGNGGDTSDMGTGDEPTDMARGAVSARDFAGLDLLGVDLYDPCETGTDPPPAIVPFPLSDYPDGGFAMTCQAGAFCNKYCPSTQYTTCCGPDKNATSGQYQLTCILDCSAGPGPGRRPEGLAPAAATSGCAVGRYFADAAHLEAASVHAFRTLARELGAHGAPASLVADAKRALRDEVRHARLTRRLARAHGGVPGPVRVAPVAPRSLEAIAVENAVEGCVRETFAALLAVHQARAAADPAVREAMAIIAPDETRHAELAWAVDRWTRSKLDRAARRRVLAARQAAATQLAAEIGEVAPSLASAVGLPDRAGTQALCAGARRALWS